MATMKIPSIEKSSTSKKTMSGLAALQFMKEGGKVSLLESTAGISYTMNTLGAILSHEAGCIPVQSEYQLQWFLDQSFIDTSTVKHITPLEALKIFAKNDGAFVYCNYGAYKVDENILYIKHDDEDANGKGWRKSNLRYNEILSGMAWFLKQ